MQLSPESAFFFVAKMFISISLQKLILTQPSNSLILSDRETFWGCMVAIMNEGVEDLCL